MNIGELILTGRRELPDALKHRGPIWVRKSDYPEDAEFEDGYPSEWACERIAMIGPDLAAAWLVDVLPEWWEECGHGFPPRVKLGPTEDFWRPGQLDYTIRLSTGGWSGLESIIGAVEGSFWLMHFLGNRRRGGHYMFVVPESNYVQSKAHLEAGKAAT